MEEKTKVDEKDPMRDSLMSNSDCEYDFDDNNSTISSDTPRIDERVDINHRIDERVDINHRIDERVDINLNNLPEVTGHLNSEGASGANSLELDFDLWEGQIDFSATNPFYDSVFMTDENRSTHYKEMIWTVQMLQHQVGALAENQVNHDDRVSRVKQDNSALQARLIMLEEQLRETEMRAEDRLAEEQRRNKEIVSRVEREKVLTIENHSIRQSSLEKEKTSIVNDNLRLKAQVDKLEGANYLLDEKLSDSDHRSSCLTKENSKLSEMSKKEREELRIERERSSQVIEDLRAEVERLRAVEDSYTKRPLSMDTSMQPNVEMEAEIKQLRSDNKCLLEQIEDVQAQLLNSRLEEGRTLVSTTNNNSLAAEFERMNNDEDAHNSSEVEKLRKTLKDSQEANYHLKNYIDDILLNIVENYPQLLEVKRSK